MVTQYCEPLFCVRLRLAGGLHIILVAGLIIMTRNRALFHARLNIPVKATIDFRAVYWTYVRETCSSARSGSCGVQVLAKCGTRAFWGTEARSHGNSVQASLFGGFMFQHHVGQKDPSLRELTGLTSPPCSLPSIASAFTCIEKT